MYSNLRFPATISENAQANQIAESVLIRSKGAHSPKTQLLALKEEGDDARRA
jgi:hypothetical protein